MSLIRSTLAYILHDDRILLMLRGKEPNQNLLSPPGGKLEKGETPEEGVQREVKEETGLAPTEFLLRGTAHHLGPPDQDEWLQYLFLVTEFRGSLRAEHREGSLAWYAVEELLSGSLPIPGADVIYNRWVLGDDPEPFSCRVVHRDDETVASVERC